MSDYDASFEASVSSGEGPAQAFNAMAQSPPVSALEYQQDLGADYASGRGVRTQEAPKKGAGPDLRSRHANYQVRLTTALAKGELNLELGRYRDVSGKRHNYAAVSTPQEQINMGSLAASAQLMAGVSKGGLEASGPGTTGVQPFVAGRVTLTDHNFKGTDIKATATLIVDSRGAKASLGMKATW